MNFPVSLSLCKLIPISIPNSCKVQTTFSVQTLPLAFFAYGQPPKPATELSMTDTPYSQFLYDFFSYL